MTVARSNPLKPGVYWTDVFRPIFGSAARDDEPAFQAWVETSPGVRLIRTEPGEVSPLKRNGGAVLRVWHSFEIADDAKPADYPFKRLGFPTVIKLSSTPGGVNDADRATTSDDTARNLPVGLGDFWSDWFGGALSGDLRPVALAALGFWLYYQVSKRK